MTAQTDRELRDIVVMLHERYNQHHNLIVTNERIRKVTGMPRRSGRRSNKLVKDLHKLGILEPYYDHEPLDRTKVWNVDIPKVRAYLNSKA